MAGENLICLRQEGRGMYETLELVVTIAFIAIAVVCIAMNIKKKKKGDDK